MIMAFIDARNLPAGEVIERDICIIGAGPAGLALAKEFAAASVRVAIIESGDREADGDTQALAWGRVVGRPYPDLDVVRLRFFGGTSNHWGGNVKPLDPWDFTERPWIAHSGWPIAAADLAGPYKRAAAFCGLDEHAYDETKLRLERGLVPWATKDDDIKSYIFHTVGERRIRFGPSYYDFFKTAANIDVFLNANVQRLAHDEAQKLVSGIIVRTLTDKQLTFRAKRYVLAAGGIENPRLLLLSRNRAGHALGNAYDLVGRYFMEHITNPEFGELIPTDPNLNLSYYRAEKNDWGETWGVFGMAEDMQRRHQLPNIRYQVADITNVFNQNENTPGFQSLKTFSDSLKQGELPTRAGDHFLNILRDIDDVVALAYYRLRYDPDYPLVKLKIVAIGEQAPNPESRVYLGEDKDRFGQPVAVLDWRLTEADSIGMQRSTAFLARALARNGIGRLVDTFPENGFASIDPHPHYHHMGTTRMHNDAKSGVVDKNCRVHGMSNLYIAGSSVFPTVGNVNPTLTIIALALRLADHLKADLGGAA